MSAPVSPDFGVRVADGPALVPALVIREGDILVKSAFILRMKTI